MIPLSAAILRGVERAPRTAKHGYFSPSHGADVLGAALLGRLRSDAPAEPFWARVDGYGPSQLAAFALDELHRCWPHIGQSVRCWPKFAEELETDRLIPRIVPLQTVYRREIHLSLWGAITKMYDAGESREDIARRLARFGL